MPIVAKVFEFEISEQDLERECAKVSITERKECLQNALKRLIDRYLLLYKAIESGITISDAEYDKAIWELLDEENPLDLWSTSLDQLTPKEMENLLKERLMINKYINSFFSHDTPVTKDKVKEFYDEQKEYFLKAEQVRCSHILISNTKKMQKPWQKRSAKKYITRRTLATTVKNIPIVLVIPPVVIWDGSPEE